MKSIFLERSKAMISLAFKEFNTYKKTRSESYLMQSGEKAWNALAQLSAYYKGKMASKHKDMLAQMEGIPHSDKAEVKNVVSLAESLHANFYHNFKEPETLHNDLVRIRELINKKLKDEGYRLRRR